MSTAEMEPLTSGASNRIIPILRTLRTSLIFIYTLLLSLVLFVVPRRRLLRRLSPSLPPNKAERSKRRREEEDTFRRRALAQELDTVFDTVDRDSQCRYTSSLFFGPRGHALFCRSWIPLSADLK
jgi:acylglycerol lipase